MDLKSLEKILNEQTTAPVESWDPEFCGDMDLIIKTDGSWWHQGSPIKRQALVNLFARIIKKQEQDYFLVTPVEKLKIEVEDAPFLAIRLEVVNDSEQPHPWLIFETNVGDQIKLDQEHPLVVEEISGAGSGPAPYITVRRNLRAKLTRSIFYELVERGEVYTEHLSGKNQQRLRVASGPHWFDLGAIE